MRNRPESRKASRKDRVEYEVDSSVLSKTEVANSPWRIFMSAGTGGLGEPVVGPPHVEVSVFFHR